VIDFSGVATNKNGIGTKPDIPKPAIKPAPIPMPIMRGIIKVSRQQEAEETMFRGRLLSEYSKKELIQIAYDTAMYAQYLQEKFIKDLSMFR